MLNELNKDMLGKPSMVSDRCVVCGIKATNQHHVIQKGMGGSKLPIPTVSLCGMGNTSGCHGLAHTGHLHFRWNGRIEYLRTADSINLETAMEKEGWCPCHEWL